jgi:two-component system KDP operon response regulator KdpE
MPATHILVIDDEVPIRRLLRSSLSERGYRVSAVATADEGLDVAASDPPAVIILDLGLPDSDGLEVCRQIRSWSEVPIVILSARYDEMEKVRALDLGADDYLTKPFSTHELLARIRVALRHAERRQLTQVQITVGELQIDLARRQVTSGGMEVRLTPTEYALLTALAGQAGRVLTHTWLLQHVWGVGYEENVQNLHVFISQLRRKIEPQPARPRYILTEPGIGYRFATSDDRATLPASKQDL